MPAAELLPAGSKIFLSGTVSAEGLAVGRDGFEPRYEQFERIWKDLAECSLAAEAIRPVYIWAGRCAFSTLDHNVISGPHNEVRNFILSMGSRATGCSSPRTLGLSGIGYDRGENEPFLEMAVI